MSGLIKKAFMSLLSFSRSLAHVSKVLTIQNVQILWKCVNQNSYLFKLKLI